VSTLLFDRPAFKNVICLGHILAEDGAKMSKSKGNIVSPWDVFNEHGVDATRWYMYTAGPPGNSRRFSVNLVGEVVRKFMNTLWNTYSFFVTYANLSDWGLGTGDWGSAQSPITNLLDSWLLSDLNRLVRDVTDAYENYDVLGATRPIEAFVDDLSNWYVRLNRRRFWDGDPAALSTLHTALVTVSKLLAPAMPYISEEIYQNLVVRVDPSASDSVHLAGWPAVDEALIDEQLHADMELAQKVTTLGRAAREGAALKVRQPLQQVVVRTRTAEEEDGLRRMEEYVLGELNIRELAFADAAGDLVDVQVFPLPKQLGQKYGAGYPKIRKAVAALDQMELAARFRAGETVEVTVESGETYTVDVGDVEVRTSPREGYSVAEDSGYLVAVTTKLTPELELEGHARELVRRVQQLRKDAGLEISDRIALCVTETPLVADLLAAHGDYVKEETLTVDLRLGIAANGVSESFPLGKEEVTINVTRAESEIV
ncbi:MAG: class I tRNA ligase family protein, partial [Caldilineaceae bacterium]|nr:class I tRNA ligase family protein [Caldilineaceae bacterium]